MFGSGVGELNVYIRPASGVQEPKKIWSLSGDAGNNWYMGQVWPLKQFVSNNLL